MEIQRSKKTTRKASAFIATAPFYPLVLLWVLFDWPVVDKFLRQIGINSFWLLIAFTFLIAVFATRVLFTNSQSEDRWVHCVLYLTATILLPIGLVAYISLSFGT